jgi:hypothetical protein
MNSSELILFASVVSIVLTEDLNKDDMNLLGNFLTSVGQNIMTIAAQIETCCPPKDSSNDTNNDSNKDTKNKTDKDSKNNSEDDSENNQEKKPENNSNKDTEENQKKDLNKDKKQSNNHYFRC